MSICKTFISRVLATNDYEPCDSFMEMYENHARAKTIKNTGAISTSIHGLTRALGVVLALE